MVEYINENQRLSEMISKLIDIQESFDGLSVEVASGTRKLVMELCAKKIGKKNPEKLGDFRLFLFNDSLLIGKVQTNLISMSRFPTGRLQFRAFLTLDKLRVVNVLDHDGGVCWFFLFTSPAIKNGFEIADRSRPDWKLTFIATSAQEKAVFMQEAKSVTKEFFAIHHEILEEQGFLISFPPNCLKREFNNI